MTNRLTYAKYRQLVEKQGQMILDALAYASTGQFDQITIDIPEGVDVMTDLAIGFSYLIDDLQELLHEREQRERELEMRVIERTQELETALEEVQAVQRRYVQREWEAYQTETRVDTAFAVPEPFLPALETAVSTSQTTILGNGQASVAVPINYADELIGVLGFAADDANTWDEEQLSAVEAIVEQVGLALENQRLFDQTQAVLTETEILYGLSAKLNAVSNTREVVEAIANIGQPSHVTLFRVETDSQGRPQWMTLIDSQNLDPNQLVLPIGTRLPTAQFSAFQTLIEHPDDPYLINDALANASLASEIEFMQKHKIGAVAWLPLVIGKRWLGIVMSTWLRPHPFIERERRIFKALTNQTSVVMNQLLLYREAQARAEREHLTREIGAQISRSIDIETILKTTARQLSQAFGTSHAVIRVGGPTTTDTQSEQQHPVQED